MQFISMTASMGSHRGSLGKGGQDLREAPYDLASQLFIIDLAFNRPRAQNPICGRSFRS